MAVSGLMEITKDTLVSGSAQVTAQRGDQTWGANYVFNQKGVQNDVLVIADALSGLYTSLVPVTSGTYTIGASGAPLRASGIFMNNNAGVPMKLIITAGGLVSGVPA